MTTENEQMMTIRIQVLKLAMEFVQFQHAANWSNHTQMTGSTARIRVSNELMLTPDTNTVLNVAKEMYAFVERGA